MLQKAACAVNAHARHAAIGRPFAVVCKKASRNLIAMRLSKPTGAHFDAVLTVSAMRYISDLYMGE
jgi:hypothetical protein